MKTIIVTRHPGLVEYLRMHYPALVEGAEVIQHAAPETVRGAHVVGVLPLHLAAEAAYITEVPLALSPEMRGRELTAAEVERVASPPITYQVERVKEVGLTST